MRKYVPNLLSAFLLLYVSLFFCRKIDFVRSDLGRLLKNGQELTERHRFLDTNFYSYTEPLRSVVYHHWATGAVYYRLFKWAGFNGLSAANILLELAALALFFWGASLSARRSVVLFCGLLALPLIAARTEIRPETFSLVFLAAYYLILTRVDRGRLPSRWLLFLPVFQVAWTNLHIFFYLGPLLALAFFFQQLLLKDVRRAARMGVLFLALSLSSLANPHFIHGAMAPLLTLFERYEYLSPETLPIPQVMKFIFHPAYPYFILSFLSASLFLVFALLRRLLKPEHFPALFLAVLFGVFTWRANRMISFFGYALILSAPPLLEIALSRLPALRQKMLERLLWTAVAGVLALGPVIPGGLFSPFKLELGIGVQPGSGRSAEFFRENHLEGPIFNNVGIGGYLIWHLFPRERVFVDNRFEAYSPDFFRQVYFPALRDEAAWKALEDKMGLNVIYFHLKMHRQYEWPISFLMRRLHDPEWAAVYLDEDAVILLRRNEKNRGLIETYGSRAL